MSSSVFASAHRSQGFQSAGWIFFAAFFRSENWRIRKSVWRSEQPPRGTVNGWRQSGQSAAAPGWTALQWSDRHRQQNVCRHGRVLGSARVSRQIEHSVKSRSKLLKLCSPSSAAIVCRRSGDNTMCDKLKQAVVLKHNKPHHAFSRN